MHDDRDREKPDVAAVRMLRDDCGVSIIGREERCRREKMPCPTTFGEAERTPGVMFAQRCFESALSRRGSENMRRKPRRRLASGGADG